MSCVALIIAGRVIAQGSDISRFMTLILMGVILGTVGAVLMVFVPGGAPNPKSEEARDHLANMRIALRDRSFRDYLGAFGCMTTGTILLTSFLPLYLKEHMGIGSGHIILLDTSTMLGGLFASVYWAWAADRIGSRRVLMRSLLLGLLIPIGWLLLPRHFPQITLFCGALYLINGAAIAGMAIGAMQLLLNRVISTENDTAYTGIYYAWAGLTGGLPPLMAGKLLTILSDWHNSIAIVTMDAYMVLFLVSLLFFVTSLILFGRPS